MQSGQPPSRRPASCVAIRIQLPGDSTCNGGPPIIIDVPCVSLPQADDHLASSRMCMPLAPETAAVGTADVRPAVVRRGRLRSIVPVAVAGDHGDVFAERFEGLYAAVDWTGEAGVRYQLTPVIVVDAGVGRHFAGIIHSNSVHHRRDVRAGHSAAVWTMIASLIPRRARRISMVATVVAVAGVSTQCSRSMFSTTAFEQSYLAASHNWAFRRRFRRADRLLNAFDYGHAKLYQTLVTQPEAAARIDGAEFEFITGHLLIHPPDVPLDESAIGPDYAKLAPELVALFDWAHALHRQLYDVWSAPGITDQQRDLDAERVLRYYRSRPDLALSSRPKSMALMEATTIFADVSSQHPKFNGLLWSYHWFQLALYDALIVGRTESQLQAGVDSVTRQFFAMLADAPAHMPREMPMAPTASPRFASRYPEAAIIFDNLHSLHDVVSDILVSPLIPKRDKRTALLAAAAAYRDDTTSVIPVNEWRQMAHAMVSLPPPK